MTDNLITKQMDFIDFIYNATSKQEPKKGMYGQIVSNYYLLKNIKLIRDIKITEAKSLDIFFYEKENRLEIDFNLLYKNYKLAEVSIELYAPFQFDFIGNCERSTNLQNTVDQLEDEDAFEIIFKFEISTDNIILQAKNENLDFQLKTKFEKINIDLDIQNSRSFIDVIEKGRKHNQLFHTLCKTITNTQLANISNADYGQNAVECLQELNLIRNFEVVPKEISFNLAEVLSLTRYGKPKTVKEHQERLFACTIILLGGFDFDMFDNFENLVTTFFISIHELGFEQIEQARAFLLNLLDKEREFNEIQYISYIIMGFDLILKDEEAFKKTFDFLEEMKILEETSFEYESISTAKRVEKTTLLFIKNTHFIKDKTLKESANKLFNSMIQMCEERYDINAIHSLFKQTFTVNQQKEYIAFLPELIQIEYTKRCKYLLDKGLTSKQTELLMKSLSNAEVHINGSDHEIELKKNVFFDAWTELYKKTK